MHFKINKKLGYRRDSACRRFAVQGHSMTLI